MKKAIIPTICAAALLFAGCGEKSSVIPDRTEMQSNLQAENYVVSVSTEDVDGVMLTAKSGKDFLAFYQLDKAEDCERLYEVVTKANPDAEQSCMYVDDAEFGNVIICGTKSAIKAAGIKLVKGDVKA